MTPSRSIVVPCFNEARALPDLVARFAALRGPPSDAAWELVLVDNGSTDGSDVILREAALAHAPWLRVASVAPPNIGYGHGILTGLRAARGELLAWTHADGQTPAADALVALELLARSPDPTRTFVKGRRRGRPLGDRAFTLGMQLAALALLREHLPDINAQPKAFHRTLLERAVDPPHDLSLDLYLYLLARRLGFELRTFDVRFLPRAHGDSRWAFSLRSRLRHAGRALSFMRDLGRR